MNGIGCVVRVEAVLLASDFQSQHVRCLWSSHSFNHTCAIRKDSIGKFLLCC